MSIKMVKPREKKVVSGPATEIFCDRTKESGKSRTQQHFRKEADINSIIARARKTGVLVDPLISRTRTPMFGDFSEIKTFQEAEQLYIDVVNRFEAMPATIRRKFDNNPGKFVEWINKPENIEEAAKLGIVDHDVPNVRYVDKDNNDITEQVINERGIFVNGMRVNRDGSPYKKPEVKPAEPAK